MMRIAAWVGAAPFIVLAAWMLWHAPHPTGCIRATGVPATWFGECKMFFSNTSVHTYRGDR